MTEGFSKTCTESHPEMACRSSLDGKHQSHNARISPVADGMNHPGNELVQHWFRSYFPSHPQEEAMGNR
jgi:hypothetical protein